MTQGNILVCDFCGMQLVPGNAYIMGTMIPPIVSGNVNVVPDKELCSDCYQKALSSIC